ncbi:histidine phosphatase family protein [Boseongicola aestuarii]|jgi:broad specificity phosphatase PhoE|uniref:Histidine phosphatase superfamily (Branch 1) n=1 Tax=Boseongicola aestuarii TaxID=1470561 RepID=A0A238IZA8_9RHOB|nr:histidine phosphatase family protein [Boseongicola aestuarii]SMX23322.1 Histidine phosphatase superfamily (branch 1) [Boseongicola aestuarii]
MGEIVLVRHGQANSAATTEDDYDRLSALGVRQSEWLGEWMRDHSYAFDHVLSGTLVRHRQTVGAMGWTADEDARLNEIDYFRLTDQMHTVLGEPMPTPETFSDHMPKVFAAWKQAEIEGQETYENFEARVADLLEEASVPGRRLLCVTSGGVIGMVLRHILDLDIVRMSHVMLPIWNTSIHRLTVRDGAAFLAGFNAIPHLDRPERIDARTHF